MTDPGTEPTTDDPATPDVPSAAVPFAEARGPHLPDAVTRLGALVWVFLLLGLARLVWFVRESPPAQPYDITTIATYASALVPSVVVVLLPAALLLRHPDAPDRARTLLLGTVLFAIVEAMRVLNPPLQPIFEQLTPGSEETPYLVPLALLYNSAIRLLGSYAIANIALGLSRARRYEDPPGGRIVTPVMVLAVSLVAIGGVVSVSQLRLDEIPMTPTVIVYLVSTVLLSIVFAAAWAYLAAVTIRGARAGELPASGWTVAATGGGLIITSYAVSSALVAVTPTPDTQALFTSIAYALSILVALGYLFLLVGLFLRLPSLDDTDDADDADDEDAEVDEEGLDATPDETTDDGIAGRHANEGIEPA